MTPRFNPKRWPACHLCNRPAVLRSGIIGDPWCLSHSLFLLVTDRLLVPPPAVLDQTAPAHAGPSPFCLALIRAATWREARWMVQDAVECGALCLEAVRR
jgi:hypothetical protein